MQKTNPYGGITRIRLYGSDLSLLGTPCRCIDTDSRCKNNEFNETEARR